MDTNYQSIQNNEETRCKATKKKIEGQIETGLNTHEGARTRKLRKLRNNKREHKKRERKIQYKDTTQQIAYNIYHKKFRIIADTRYSVKRNVVHLINTITDTTDLS